jgi:hypothetical protein
MLLPAGFQFTQAAFQDFVDCPRRFQLRYLYRLSWPALEAEPASESEKTLIQGQRFHRLIQQHLSGVPQANLNRRVSSPELSIWWSNYLEHGPSFDKLDIDRWPEVGLYAPFGDWRLAARFDALVVDHGPDPAVFIILDWKTSRKRPSQTALAARLQTRVYPYLLARAGSHFNRGEAVDPDQIEMIYWFAGFPHDPQRFSYSIAQYATDEAYLLSLLECMQAAGPDDFNRVEDPARCLYCAYRSLCGRGLTAGPLDERDDQDQEPDSGFVLDFDAVEEVSY